MTALFLQSKVDNRIVVLIVKNPFLPYQNKFLGNILTKTEFRPVHEAELFMALDCRGGRTRIAFLFVWCRNSYPPIIARVKFKIAKENSERCSPDDHGHAPCCSGFRGEPIHFFNYNLTEPIIADA